MYSCQTFVEKEVAIKDAPMMRAPTKALIWYPKWSANCPVMGPVKSMPTTFSVPTHASWNVDEVL